MEKAKLSREDKSDLVSIKERDLTGHLENGNGAKAKTSKKTPKDKQEDLASSDYQLFEALNLLKGLSIARQLKQ